ncbi:MAG: hypothetical protein WCO57_03015 [Verrucomicrobiota bacterium]
MNATSYLNTNVNRVTNGMKDGVRADFANGQTHATFNLGLDISPLRPRQRIVVRALLQRMCGMTQTALNS